MINYYDLLEVTNRASVEVIRAAYKTKVKQYHPDNFKTERDKNMANEKLKVLNEAVEVLTDENARSEYDRELNGQAGFTQEEDTGNTQASGEFDASLLQTVEGMIARCKTENEYLGLRSRILKLTEDQYRKEEMLQILDEYTRVRLQQELEDEAKLDEYQEEVKVGRTGIIAIFVIGLLLTGIFSSAFVISLVLMGLVYMGSKDDRDNLSRAQNAVKHINVYRMRGFGI